VLIQQRPLARTRKLTSSYRGVNQATWGAESRLNFKLCSQDSVQTLLWYRFSYRHVTQCVQLDKFFLHMLRFFLFIFRKMCVVFIVNCPIVIVHPPHRHRHQLVNCCHVKSQQQTV